MRRNEGQSVLVCCCEGTIRQNIGSSSSEDLRSSSIDPISRFTARPHLMLHAAAAAHRPAYFEQSARNSCNTTAPRYLLLLA